MVTDRLIASLAGAAALACAAAAVTQSYRLSATELALANTETKLATEKRGREADRAAAAGVAASAITAYRAEEQRRAAALQETVNAARQEADLAVRARAAAERAAAGLRGAAAAAAAAASCRGAAAGRAPATAGSAPASSPGELLADVLVELEAAGRAAADEADRRRTAGLACERAYDSLTAP